MRALPLMRCGFRLVALCAAKRVVLGGAALAAGAALAYAAQRRRKARSEGAPAHDAVA